MLYSQFLATCLQPSHASFPIVTADSGPRIIKQSLQMGFSDQINDLLVYGCITDIKVARKIIQYPYESCERGDQKCKWVTLDGCA